MPQIVKTSHFLAFLLNMHCQATQKSLKFKIKQMQGCFSLLQTIFMEPLQ